MNLRKVFYLFLAIILLTGSMLVTVKAQNQNQDEKKAEKQKDDEDADDTPAMQKELAKEAKISLEEARKIALTRLPGTVTESEMGREKGKVVYEFEIKDKDNKSFDVLVDAKTGEVVSVEPDDDSDKDDPEPALQSTNDKSKWFKVWRKIPGLGRKKT